MTGNLVYQFGDPALGVARTYITSNIKKGILFSNTAGYSNPEVDRLFEEAAVATSDDKRQELYSQVQRILVEDVPVVWTFEQDYPNFIDKRAEERVVDGDRGARDVRGGELRMTLSASNIFATKELR